MVNTGRIHGIELKMPLGMRRLAVALALGVVPAGFADPYQISTAYDLQVDGSTTTFTVASVDMSAYPSALGDPIFWFDASDTAGWEFDSTGKGVTKIPSKTGSRYLTTDGSGGHWYQWEDGKGPLAPQLVDDPGLKPGKAVDFGDFGSRMCMVFNPWIAAEGCTASNTLANIGTVVAVYGSHANGGWLLGGGKDGYFWHRGYSATLASTSSFLWSNPVFQSNTGDAIEYGVFRHDGVPTVPSVVSYSHDWEVISLVGRSYADAYGLGVGDTRSKNYSRTAGMKVAEMLVFDRFLSTEELEKLEAWLQWKWFGRAVRGNNGNTTLGRFRSYSRGSGESGVSNTIEVPAGETLRIDRLEGGGGTNPSIVKTGAGVLQLANAEGYNGTVRLKGGTLDWPGQAVPNEADLPHDLYLHFDASRLASLTLSEEGGRQYVMCWSNLVSGATSGGKSIRAVAASVERRPWLILDALGPGLHAVDFSVTGDANSDGRYLKFTTDAYAGNYGESGATMNGIATVVALVGAQNGGGHIVSSGESAFVRHGGGKNFSMGLLDTGKRSSDPQIGIYEGHVALDGSFCNPTGAIFTCNATTTRYAGYMTPGWHTVSLQTYGGNVSLLGARDETYMGGGRYAEVLIWNRPLSDDEVVAAQAYLAKKWFGRRIPGYAASSEPAVPDIQKVGVEEASSISVGGADSVRIGTLSLSSPLVKKGTGTLTVGVVTNTDMLASSLDIQEGTVRLVGPPDVMAKCEIAAEPSLHLDASNTNNMALVVSGNDILVDNWVDESNREGVFASQPNLSSHRPRLDVANTCNGLPVVDFGARGANMFFTLCRSLDSVRHIFVVADLARGGWLLGSHTGSGDLGNGGNVDFHRGTSGGEAGYGKPGAPLFHGFCSLVNNGEIYTNGVSTVYNMTPADGMQLLEIHPIGGTHLSGLAVDRETSRKGGPRLGEIVVFERELTAREKIATRNALMKKWFGRSEDQLADLPDYDPGESALGAVELAGGDGVLQIDTPANATSLSGEGMVTKTGSGTLAVEDLSSFTGTVTVASGTLKLPVAATPANAGLVTDGRILHLDATQGLTTETASDGTVYVREWASVLGDGWTACASGANGVYPSLMTRGNGHDPGFSDRAADMPAVDMLGGKANNQYFLFRKDGDIAQLTGIRSVFWVIGSQRGGGWLLGGGSNPEYAHGYPWHRGDVTGTGSDSGDVASQALLGAASLQSLRSSFWRLNGKSVKPFGAGAGCLSGDWDYLSMTLAADYTSSPPSADGLAFDGRILLESSTTDFNVRDGRQRLGEVIVYDRILSPAEVISNECYLAEKWGFAQPAGRNRADVVLAAGARLDCGGAYQYVASIAGSGTVTNGTLAAGAVRYDYAEDKHVVVDGTFDASAGTVVELSGIPARASLVGTGVTVMEASSVLGVDAMSVAAADGESLPHGLEPHVRVVGEAVKVAFVKVGTVLHIR